MSFYLKKYMWLITLIAVIFCSYFLARVTVHFIALKFGGGSGLFSAVTKPSAKETTQSKQVDVADYESIIKRNIFDSRDLPPPPEGDEEPTEDQEVAITGEAVPTTLKIKLVSTFVVGDGSDERSSAIISSGRGKEGDQVYTVNDKNQFEPDTKIVKISHRRVEFLHKGRLEYVELEDFASGIDLNKPPQHDLTLVKETRGGEKEPLIEKKTEGTFVIDRAEIDNAITNLDKLYTQIRVVPHFKEGRPNGLKLLSVRSDSIFAKLGLKRGDILQKINGMELDIKRGLEIFNQLKSENQITIELERRNRVQTLEYEIR